MPHAPLRRSLVYLALATLCCCASQTAALDPAPASRDDDQEITVVLDASLRDLGKKLEA